MLRIQYREKPVSMHLDKSDAVLLEETKPRQQRYPGLWVCLRKKHETLFFRILYQFCTPKTDGHHTMFAQIAWRFAEKQQKRLEKNKNGSTPSQMPWHIHFLKLIDRARQDLSFRNTGDPETSKQGDKTATNMKPWSSGLSCNVAHLQLTESLPKSAPFQD